MTGHTQSVKRWTTILGATFCVLVAGISYQLWQDAKSINVQQPLDDLASTVRIVRPDFADMNLARNDEGWQIQSPCNLAVNVQRLQPLLSALTPSTFQYQADEVDLEAAGLVTPLATVYINEQQYRIGHTDLRGERRYVQRGNTVEFAPEWVLSLVNGGMTALAKLELFTAPLQLLVRMEENGTSHDLSSPQILESWQGISAQQIISWPPPAGEPSLDYRLQATDINGNAQTLMVYNTKQFTAVKHEEAACAYILDTDSLPDS